MNQNQSYVSGILKEINKIANILKKHVNIMEVCGTHTVTAARSGLYSLLPQNVHLLSGPGCPVCVTEDSYIDTALNIAKQTDVTVATFGDMIRVPGTNSSLELEMAKGADILIVYSPEDALKYAINNPKKTVVFLGVGFETTACAVAWSIKYAKDKNINNFYVLSAHKLIPPAMMALLSTPDVNIDAFICPGHVSVITGANAYNCISRLYHVPCIITGFEFIDMLQGILMALQQIVNGESSVSIQYKRCVKKHGNQQALNIIDEVFEPYDAEWRGLGVIPKSGLKIREKYQSHDAHVPFAAITVKHSKANTACRCGDVLRGVRTPIQCPLFGGICTPQSPVGPCMVSSEGSCAAYYKYNVGYKYINS